jgi:large subunit ribosomal protein L21
MYAVIESGGKQYRVELGAEIQVDRLDARPGDAITLDRVLLVADGDSTAVGRPVVDGASVSAQVLRQERGDKIVVFKYKPKARARVKKGHRAELTTLRIADIAFGGKSAAKEAERAESRKSKATREAEQQAEEKAAADRELAARLASAAAATEAESQPAATDAASEPAAPKRAARRKAAAEAAATAEPSAGPEMTVTQAEDQTDATAEVTPQAAARKGAQATGVPVDATSARTVAESADEKASSMADPESVADAESPSVAAVDAEAAGEGTKKDE